MMVLSYVVSGVISEFFCMYLWFKLYNEEKIFRNYKFYLGLAVLVVFGTMINIFLPRELKIASMFVLLFLTNYFLFRKGIVMSFISLIVLQFVTMVCELFFVFGAQMIVGEKIMDLQYSFYGLILTNIFITMLNFLFLFIKIPFYVYYFCLNIFKIFKKKKIIIGFIASAILTSVFMILSWIDLSTFTKLIINSVLVVLYFCIIVGIFYTQERLIRINSKFENSLSSLREYSDMMDKYRIVNHENKNQLMTIRNMIKNGDSGIDKYIDNLIKNVTKDNKKIFSKMSKIPDGSLRAIIYSKVCKMDELGIKYKLSISNDVKAVDLLKVSDDTTLNICKILGVFLDNSIEYVENMKEGFINIELYMIDDALMFDISNTCSGEFDVNKISKIGYSTKGKGHGYGLVLVDNIIDGDKLLSNEKEIINDMFIQRIILDLKKCR